MDTTPTTAPASSTGRWRKRPSVIICMHACAVSSRPTVATSAVMMSRTGVVAEDRPSSTTFLA
jgi:hypothetical protein